MDADTIAKRVSPHLPVGERHVVAFSGAEGPAARFAMRYRVVAVTDRAIHVFRARPWRICDPGQLLSTHPLGSMIERPSKLLALSHEIVIGERRLWVPVAWDDELAEAMAAGSADAAPALAVTRSSDVTSYLRLIGAAMIVTLFITVLLSSLGR